MARHYRYVVVNRRAPLVFERGRAWLVKKPLDAAAMHEAAQALIGRHDFSTFRDAQCQANSPLRTLDYFRVDSATARRSVSTSARARSCIGRCARWWARWSRSAWANGAPADFRAAFEAADRSRCGPVAPPDGLYLMRVDYPEK